MTTCTVTQPLLGAYFVHAPINWLQYYIRLPNYHVHNIEQTFSLSASFCNKELDWDTINMASLEISVQETGSIILAWLELPIQCIYVRY